MFPVPSTVGYTVFIKTGCSFCELVKKLLEEEKFTGVNCDEYLTDQKEAFLTHIESLAGKSHRTFPMVFHEGRFLGGFTETKTYYEALLSN
jgi:glutaredoxin